MSSVEILPEEILLNIFSYLGRKDVGRCLQVSKRFRNIAQDDSLWNKLEIENKVFRSKYIAQALSYGLKQLHLEKCRLQFAPMKLPESHQLQSLYFSTSWNAHLGGIFELDFLSLKKLCHKIMILFISIFLIMMNPKSVPMSLMPIN